MQRACLLIVLVIASVSSAMGQHLEASGFAGYGWQAGDDQQKIGKGSYGASFGWQSTGRSGVVVDYAYADFAPRSYDRHWLTGSYRLQATTRRVRPFFQAGMGAMWTRNNSTATDIAVVLGVGATIEARSSFFVRPQFRTYGYVGPTLMNVFGVAAGFRF